MIHRLSPNLIIPGVQKAGTTALFDLLVRQPEVHGVPGKEVHVYSRRDPEPAMSLFDGAFPQDARYRLDASTSYFFVPQALQRLAASDDGERRLMLVLREPESRAVSAFHQVAKQKRYGTLGWYEERDPESCLGLVAETAEELREREQEAIEEAVAAGTVHLAAYVDFLDPLWAFRYLSNSLYSERIELLLELFPRERLFFLDQRRLRCDDEELTHAIFSFLELDPPDRTRPMPTSNVSTVPRKGGLWEGVHLLYPYVRKALGSAALDGPYRRFAWQAPQRHADAVHSSVQAVFRRDMERVRALTGLDLSPEAES